MKAMAEPVVWAHEDAPFTGAQVRDLLAENARLRAMNEALAKVAVLTQERDMLRTALGYWHGVRLDRVVRDRDENATIASAAMTAGLAECESLRSDLEDEWLNRM